MIGASLSRFATCWVAVLSLTACLPRLEPQRGPDAGNPAPCPACPAPKLTRIAIVGDRTGHPDDAVFFDVLREIKRLEPDIIISIGDLIEGYQPDDRIDEAAAEWKAVLSRLTQITGDIPLMATAGNHDVWSEASERLFVEKIGHSVNHSFSVGTTQIIIFDTSRYPSETEIPETDLAWLWHALYRARHQTERVVFTHRPLWAQSPGGTYGAPLHDIFIAGRADTVITGHWHHAMSDERDGVRYRMIGTSGASPNRPDHPESGNFHQFGLLTIDAHGAELSLIPAGSIMRSDRFPYRLNQAEYKIEHRAVRPLGFDIDPGRPAPTGRFQLKITNVSDAMLDATLSFKPTHWHVVPRKTRLKLHPTASQVIALRYHRKQGAPLFPGPEMTLDFPWPDKGSYRLSKAIDPILTHRARQVRTPPVVDGILDDTCWKRASVVTAFYDKRGQRIQGDTRIETLMVNDTLYLGADMTERDMAGQPSSKQGRDGFLEEGDHLVIWLNGNPETPPYVKVVINADGAVWDRWVRSGDTREAELAWNGIQTVAVAKSDAGWTVEMAIPLAEIGWTGADRIGFNIARGRWRSQLQRIYWQPLLEHDTDSFGALLLE